MAAVQGKIDYIRTALGPRATDAVEFTALGAFLPRTRSGERRPTFPIAKATRPVR